MSAPIHPKQKAVISDEIKGAVFPWRVFYYAPGMGFDTGRLVFVGRSEFRTKAKAEEAKKRYDRQAPGS